MIIDIEQAIKETEAQIAPLTARLERLRREKAERDSRSFIAVNKITRDDVEMSSGDGKPWFWIVGKFADWLSANSKKRWAEWNGRIYHTSDLLAGRMPDMPGKVEHLP